MVSECSFFAWKAEIVPDDTWSSWEGWRMMHNSLCVTSVLLLVDTGRPLNLSFIEVQSCSFVCPLVIGVALSCLWSLDFFQGRDSWLLGLCPVVLFFHTQCVQNIRREEQGAHFSKPPPVTKHFSPVLYAGWWQSNLTVSSGKEICFKGQFYGILFKNCLNVRQQSNSQVPCQERDS